MSASLVLQLLLTACFHDAVQLYLGCVLLVLLESHEVSVRVILSHYFHEAARHRGIIVLVQSQSRVARLKDGVLND